jgi:squalene-hopene/tetraprenyl-beta-curcumene cyclase
MRNRLLTSLQRMHARLILALSLTLASAASAQSPAQSPAQSNGSLQNEVSQSVSRGRRWIESQQDASGAWSEPKNPAITALALMSILRAEGSDPSAAGAIEKGFRFLRSNVQADGGVYSEGLSNYNTAISLLAFLKLGDPMDAVLIKNARDFLVKQQAEQMMRPELNGGIGYGPSGVSPKRQHPDLDNTLVSLEALRSCELADSSRENIGKRGTLDWAAAIAFVSRCQNLPSSNPAEWVSRSESERGGFVYYPGFSNAGEVEEQGGRKALRSSGSMSYAGLLSFIYADVSREDPRVQAALDWLRQNFTLEENPGLGRQGLYYYYHLMAKALTASKTTTLQSSGKSHDWARELAIELINRQQSAGFWVNDTGRWMEKDSVLVTAYGLLTLELLKPQL